MRRQKQVLHAGHRGGSKTALVEASTPISVLQTQMTYSNVSTALRLSTNAIRPSYRAPTQGIGLQSPPTGNQHWLLGVTDQKIK
jgi:hypothetical protein